VMPLKSGQVPPMYASLHWSNWRDRLEALSSKAIRPELLETRTVARTGVAARVVPRHMPSLETLGAKYPPYESHERRMHRPQRKWKVLKYGSADERARIKL